MKVPKWNNEPFKVFVKDIESRKLKETFEPLREGLSLKTNRMSYEHIIRSMDDAAENYFISAELYLIAENEVKNHDTYAEIKMAELLDEAQTILEGLKTEKKITGQITIEMRKNWIIQNKKDEYRALEDTKRELRIARGRFEALRDAWRQRMSLLQSQARALESKRSTLLPKGGDNE